jgi:hypothetical protein
MFCLLSSHVRWEPIPWSAELVHLCTYLLWTIGCERKWRDTVFDVGWWNIFKTTPIVPLNHVNRLYPNLNLDPIASLLTRIFFRALWRQVAIASRRNPSVHQDWWDGFAKKSPYTCFDFYYEILLGFWSDNALAKSSLWLLVWIHLLQYKVLYICTLFFGR